MAIAGQADSVRDVAARADPGRANRQRTDLTTRGIPGVELRVPAPQRPTRASISVARSATAVA